jgi:hypothetical protein
VSPTLAEPHVGSLDLGFERRFFFNGAELVAARWWHVDMKAVSAAGVTGMPIDEDRRAVMLMAGGVALAVLVFSALAGSSAQDDDTQTITADALELQRKEGWNVGAPGEHLYYRGATGLNVAGSSDWLQHVDELPGVLRPTQPRYETYCIGTLFQVLSSADFCQSLYPVSSDATTRAYARGQALAALFRDPLAMPDTALIVDMEGPEAVAVAAGLSDTFEPVFLFDNWPHPRGVVPSHEVVGAAAYYQPVFAANRAPRSEHAPPVFVLDSLRLLPYVDDADRFDNRYLARLPSASGFGELGIKHVLYVTESVVPHELDDLNDDFVALSAAGIDVKMVALSQFQPPDSAQPLLFTYGGMHEPHVWFWSSYGSVPRALPRTEIPPMELSQGARYSPAPRATIFSSRVVGGGLGVGKARPTGFGRVSWQGARVASSSGRTGSFGRVHFFHGG